MKQRNITMLAAALGMTVLIFDAKTALQAASEGIDLCLLSLIPSLFPFLLLSSLLTAALAGQVYNFMRPMERLLRIPTGSGCLFIVGLIGGYPVGAQMISQACRSGQISPNDARRMIGFCNNAGPAFLFGIVGQAFDQPLFSWFLWLIHIAGAVLVGMILPGTGEQFQLMPQSEPLTLPKAMEKAIRTMAVICGWVIFFRILLGFLDRWVLWRLPVSGQVLTRGLLELSNGCVDLKRVPDVGMRFMIASVMLGFGGCCVWLQTRSVCGRIPSDRYIYGKLLHAVISYLICSLLQYTSLPDIRFLQSPAFLICAVLILIFLLFALRFDKISVAFCSGLMYNKKNAR